MSLTPTEVESKIRQLDNDMQAIYELLSAIQGTQTRHTNRLHELGETVGDLQILVTSLDQKMDTVLELLRER